MTTDQRNVTGTDAGPGSRPGASAEPIQLMIDAKAAARRCGLSVRTWLRLCDAGKAPWGTKLGTLRRWSVAELDEWIRNGCPTVRSAKGGGR